MDSFNILFLRQGIFHFILWVSYCSGATIFQLFHSCKKIIFLGTCEESLAPSWIETSPSCYKRFSDPDQGKAWPMEKRVARWTNFQKLVFFQTIQVVTFSLFFGGNLPLKVAFWYIPSEKMYTLSKSYISITILGRLYMEYDWCTL